MEGPLCPVPPPVPTASRTRRSTSCSTPSTTSTGLVLNAAKRARQINAYYTQLGEGLLEYVGPLVETQSGEAAVHRAPRDQLRPADPGARRDDPRPDALRWVSRQCPPASSSASAGVSRRTRPCELLRGCSPSAALASGSFRRRPCRSSVRRPGRRCPVSRSTTDVWTAVDQVQHVSLARSADLVLVVPATADLLARAANGRADDLLTATLLTVRCPVVMAPAMHTEMWKHPATGRTWRRSRDAGSIVARAGRRPADRIRQRCRPAARTRRDLRRRAQATRRRPPRRPVGRRHSGLGGGHPRARSTRSASSATDTVGRAGRSARTAAAARGAAGDADRREPRRWTTPASSTSSRSRPRDCG